MAVPYTIPSWSAAPCHQFYLEVRKDGSIINQFQVNDKGAYMFGRVNLSDFVLDHPTPPYLLIDMTTIAERVVGFGVFIFLI